jgi:nitroreductase
MSLIAQLRDRSSAKGFTDQPIKPEDLEVILEAMSYSPRAANLQHFFVRYLKDPADRKRLSQVLFNCRYIQTASLVLVFFVDLATTRQLFENDGVTDPFDNWIGYHLGLADALIALQTAALVAENLGYSTRVQSGTVMRMKAARQLFDCSPGIWPTFTLMIGNDGRRSSTKRDNLNWNLFAAEGFSPCKPRSKEVYVDSGKVDKDLKSFTEDPMLAKQSHTHPSLTKLLVNSKYQPNEMNDFSRNLEEELSRYFKDGP